MGSNKPISFSTEMFLSYEYVNKQEETENPFLIRSPLMAKDD